MEGNFQCDRGTLTPCFQGIVNHAGAAGTLWGSNVNFRYLFCATSVQLIFVVRTDAVPRCKLMDATRFRAPRLKLITALSLLPKRSSIDIFKIERPSESYITHHGFSFSHALFFGRTRISAWLTRRALIMMVFTLVNFMVIMKLDLTSNLRSPLSGLVSAFTGRKTLHCRLQMASSMSLATEQELKYQFTLEVGNTGFLLTRFSQRHISFAFSFI